MKHDRSSNFSRRRALQLGAGYVALTGAGLASCQRSAKTNPDNTSPNKAPDAALGSPVATEPVMEPGRGMVILRGDDVIHQEVSGIKRPLGPDDIPEKLAMTVDSPFRAASMSKTVGMLTARELVRDGKISWDVDVQEVLKVPFRHPKYPKKPITLSHLFEHTALMTDPDAYWIDAPGDIRTLIKPEIFNPDATEPPGGFFQYCNFGYGLAATVLEVLTGERYDLLTHRLVTEPLGLDVGFNWSGVSPRKRASGATLYSGSKVVDGLDVLMASAPKIDAPADYDLKDYPPGQNGTLFSPQGGMRASLMDLAHLVKYLGSQPDLKSPMWHFNGNNGSDEDGHFLNFGRGVYLYPADQSPLPGRALIGHQGFAYGMIGGMWSDGEFSFAFADLGAADAGGVPSGRRPNVTTTAAHYFDKAAKIISGA